MAAVLSVVSSLLVGIILVVAPWTGLWESNYLLAPHPVLRSFLLSSFTRGGISGLGVINILLAMDEVRQLLGSRARGGGFRRPRRAGIDSRGARSTDAEAEAEGADEGDRF